jgi:hypothetical protein
MYSETLVLMVAVTADFVFNRWDLEILPYYRIRHIPWCVRYHAQSLRLEAFEYEYGEQGIPKVGILLYFLTSNFLSPSPKCRQYNKSKETYIKKKVKLSP